MDRRALACWKPGAFGPLAVLAKAKEAKSRQAQNKNMTIPLTDTFSLPPFNLLTDLTFYNKVALTFDDAEQEVEGQTLPGHLLDGQRRWHAQRSSVDPCAVYFKTWARERSINSIDQGNRKLVNFAIGDLQSWIWTDYFTNIGNHWKQTRNATFTEPIPKWY